MTKQRDIDLAQAKALRDEQRRARDAKALKLLRDGVPQGVVAKRLGMNRSTLCDIVRAAS